MFKDEIRLAQLAIDNSGAPSFDEEILITLLEATVASPDMFLKCDGNSILWGAITPYLLDPSILIAKEIFWFSETPSKNSYRMFREFEAWAQEKGAKEIHMESLSNSLRVGDLFERKGYSNVSTIFRKEL